MLISVSNTQSGMPHMADPLIVELQGLCAGYGEIQVLWGIDMAVRRGEITALIGSNGAGKTTLNRSDGFGRYGHKLVKPWLRHPPVRSMIEYGILHEWRQARI